MNNRVSLWPRGKLLGGSGAINAMFYVRGDPLNFDTWRDRYGCTGWGYKDVLELFKKSENFCGSTGKGWDPSTRVRDRNSPMLKKYHGFNGPLTVSDPMRGNPNIWSQRFIQMMIDSGIPANPDYNGEQIHGVGMGWSTVHDGVRESTATAFLWRNGAIRSRKNLTVLPNCLVEKLFFQGDYCMGLLCKPTKGNNPASFFIHAKKEVILCSGAINSPLLLLKSGIGPAPLLKSVEIPVVRDLPVGENLQDHLMLPFVFEALAKNTLDDIAKLSFSRIVTLLKFLMFKTGYGTSCGLESSAFITTGIDPQDNQVDLQIQFVPFGPNESTKIKMNAIETFPVSPDNCICFLPTLVLPKSRGFIRLDQDHNPVINPCYFSEPTDLEILVRGVQICRKAASSPSMEGIVGKEVTDPELTKRFDPDSIEYIREYIKKHAVTIYHPVGTAKMGSSEDSSAVVTPDLKLKGIKNLRVADASVMPQITSGNTNAPSIMIGEKAAELISKYHS